MKPLLVFFILDEPNTKIGSKHVPASESFILENASLKPLLLQSKMLKALEIHN